MNTFANGQRGGSGFDRVARVYRWLEYLTFGLALEHCRDAQLARIKGLRRALVLGDGDGRFTSRLLAQNSQAQVVAVDSSVGMLRLLSARVGAICASSRVLTVCGDAISVLEQPAEAHLRAASISDPALSEQDAAAEELFDHVCTHFFLDCLGTAEVERLVRAVCSRLAPGAIWIVSEFAAPNWWTRLVVALLYKSFAVLAGLETQQLPPWRQSLANQGLVCESEQLRLGGLLTSSVWRWDGPPRPGTIEGNHASNLPVPPG